MASKTVVMPKEDVIYKYGLCAVCANRNDCDERPDDMVVDYCSSYDDDGAKEYKVREDVKE